MLVAEFEDVGRRHRADPVDRFELFDGRAAEADRPFFGAGAGGRGRRAARPELRDEDLLAVGEPCREVDRFQRGAAGRRRRLARRRR